MSSEPGTLTKVRIETLTPPLPVMEGRRPGRIEISRLDTISRLREDGRDDAGHVSRPKRRFSDIAT